MTLAQTVYQNKKYKNTNQDQFGWKYISSIGKLKQLEKEEGSNWMTREESQQEISRLQNPKE